MSIYRHPSNNTIFIFLIKINLTRETHL